MTQPCGSGTANDRQPRGAAAATLPFPIATRLLEVFMGIRPVGAPTIGLDGKPSPRIRHITRVPGPIDPVTAEYRIAFAPLDGSRLGRQAQREGLDSLTDFLRQGRCPDSGDRTDVAGSREAPGSLHPAYRADACPGRGARALAPPDDATGDEAMGVYSELRGFIQTYRTCGIRIGARLDGFMARGTRYRYSPPRCTALRIESTLRDPPVSGA